jgi:hypothetical protein
MSNATYITLASHLARFISEQENILSRPANRLNLKQQ